jgi:hypothetical protein
MKMPKNEKPAVTPNCRNQKSMLVKNAENLFLTVMTIFYC